MKARELIILLALVLACAVVIRLSAGELLAPDMQHLIDAWMNGRHV